MASSKATAAQIARLGTLFCWLLSCIWLLCDGLKCTSSILEVKLLPGNCSFCVTLTDNLLQGGNAHRTRSFCSQPLSSIELAMTLDEFDASLSEDSIQPHQFESFSARRLTKLCLAHCRSAQEDMNCGYTAAATTNITDFNGEVLGTVVVRNITYLCCRGADYCNSASRSFHIKSGSIPVPALPVLACLALTMLLLPSVTNSN